MTTVLVAFVGASVGLSTFAAVVALIDRALYARRNRAARRSVTATEAAPRGTVTPIRRATPSRRMAPPVTVPRHLELIRGNS